MAPAPNRGGPLACIGGPIACFGGPVSTDVLVGAHLSICSFEMLLKFFELTADIKGSHKKIIKNLGKHGFKNLEKPQKTLKNGRETTNNGLIK